LTLNLRSYSSGFGFFLITALIYLFFAFIPKKKWKKNTYIYNIPTIEVLHNYYIPYLYIGSAIECRIVRMTVLNCTNYHIFSELLFRKIHTLTVPMPVCVILYTFPFVYYIQSIFFFTYWYIILNKLFFLKPNKEGLKSLTPMNSPCKPYAQKHHVSSNSRRYWWVITRVIW